MGYVRHYGSAQLPLQIDGARVGTIVPYFFRIEAGGDPGEMDPEELSDFGLKVNSVVDRHRNTALVGASRATVKRVFDELCQLFPDRHIIAEGLDMYMEQTAIGPEVNVILAGRVQQFLEDHADMPGVKMLLDEIKTAGEKS